MPRDARGLSLCGRRLKRGCPITAPRAEAWPGPGHGAPPGHRVVDRVETARADDRRAVAGRRLVLLVDPADQLVQQTEEFVELCLNNPDSRAVDQMAAVKKQ